MTATATGPVATEMKQRLVAALAPTRLDLDDQSDHHIGHAGHDERGESHFALTLEAPGFAGKSRVERQRLIYASLGELMGNPIHALALSAKAPGE